MCWICVEHRVDKIQLLLLLLSRLLTKRAKAFFAFHTTMLVRRLGVHRRLEGDMAASSAYKMGGERRERGTFGTMVFAFPHHHYV